MWLSPPLALLLLLAEPNDLEQALRKFSQVYGLVESQAADPVSANAAI